MSVRTANRMLNRNSAALPTRPFDACYGGSDHGGHGSHGGHGGYGGHGGHGGLGGGHGGHTLYSESGSQRSLGEFSQGSQDDSLRRHGSSHVPKPPLFNTPKHMYSGADTSQLPLDPGCLHHLLRKVGDHETTVKTQETSIRMLQDRLTRMGQSVTELTQSNTKRTLPPMSMCRPLGHLGRACLECEASAQAECTRLTCVRARAAENEELRLLREQLASSSRHAEDAMLASQREQSGRMEQMVLQLQLQISDALAERSSPAAAHKRSRREVVAEQHDQYQHHHQHEQQELMSEDEDEDEGEGEYEYEYEYEEGEQQLQEDAQQLSAPEPTHSPPPSEATELDLFGDPAPPPLQVSK